MTKLKALTRKQLRAFIAILVAVCVVVSGMVVGLHVFADGRRHIKGSEPDYLDVSYTEPNSFDVGGLETSKEVVSYDPANNSYRLKLTAHATAASLNIPDTDIMLVMDLSKRMTSTLYQRDKENLYTNTVFDYVPFSGTYKDWLGFTHTTTIKHDELFDNDNGLNSDRWTDDVRQYSNNKYIKDPNNPNAYVYLSQTFVKLHTSSGSGLGTRFTSTYKFQYSFVDSYGNVYQTKYEDNMFSSTGIDGTYVTEDTAAKAQSTRNPIPSLKFYLVSQADPDVEPRYSGDNYYEVFGFYSRPDLSSADKSFIKKSDINEVSLTKKYEYDTSATNKVLFAYQEAGHQLYIKDDNGEFKRVTILQADPITVTNPENGKTSTIIPYYKYTCENGMESIQGNSIYGAEYGVFQGFKTYMQQDDGTWVVDHENSLDSRTLYMDVPAGDSNVTRLQQEKESIEDFLYTVHRSAYENKLNSTDGTSYSKIRVGLTTYGNEDNTILKYNLDEVDMTDDIAVARMVANVYSYTYTEKTISTDKNEAYINGGMQNAYTELRAKPSSDRKITVVFSSGMPSRNGFGWAIGGANTLEESLRGYDAKNDFCVPEANNAIETSYKIKNELGASVYTIGLFNYANVSQTHGDKFKYLGGESGYYFNDTPCDGEVGNAWGASGIRYVASTPESLNDIDAAANNRFLNYLSSNYMDSESLGLIQGWSSLNPGRTYHHLPYYWLATRGTGFQITKNYARGSSDYYFGVNTDGASAEHLDSEMKSIWRTVAERAQSPEAQLGTDAIFTDSITDYFKLKDNSIVSAYIADKSGNWLEDLPSENVVLSNKDESDNYHTISLTGFDYTGEGNYWTNDGGKQLVLEFDLLPADGFLGGNAVPTNISNSGVFDKKKRLEELFDVPSVDVKLNGTVNTYNQSIYSGDVVNLEELLNLKTIDGTNNEFVDVIYTIKNTETNQSVVYKINAGESQGSFISGDDSTTTGALANHPALYDTTKYTVTSTVQPSAENEPLGTRKIAEAVSESENAWVYVFKPAFTEHDGYVETEGDSVDFAVNAASSNNPYITMQWATPAKADEDTKGVPNVAGTAPVLTLTISDNTGGAAAITVATNETQKLVAITKPTDYQITAVNRASYSKDYPYFDENDTSGQETKTTITYPAHDLSLQNQEVSYTNEKHRGLSDTQKHLDTEGRFTIRTSKPTFLLDISKTFSGPYAGEETVSFNVAPKTGATQDNTLTVTFEVSDENNDFTHLTATKTVGEVECGETYVVTETFAAGVDETTAGAKDRQYLTTYTGIDGGTQTDENATNGSVSTKINEVYEFTVPANPVANGKLTLTVNNHDTSDIPVTGISENNHSSNILLLALAASATISVGGYGTYRVYRPRKE